MELHFLKNLSDQILNQKYDEIEACLRQALHNVELIGELHIDRETFEFLCQKLQWECLLNGQIQVDRLKSAIFLVSMVFSARYAQDEYRSFWQPYAEQVWGIEYDTSFYNTCRSYYQSIKSHFIWEYSFDFPARDTGGVVRSIYWHTILPAYLHDDLASWLKKHIHTISTLSHSAISQILQDPESTRYMAPRLRRFLTDDDTHETAVELIRELTTAFELLTEGESAEHITGLFTGLIQRELWHSFLAELSPDAIQTRNRSWKKPRLQWVWSMAYQDWLLRIVDMTLPPGKKPALAIWSSELPDDAFWTYYHQVDIWPTQRPDGSWYENNISLGFIDKLSALNAQIYLYDERDSLLYTLPIPPLPDDTIIICRLTQQDVYGVPIDDNQLTDGSFLFCHDGQTQLMNDVGQPLDPVKTFSSPDHLHDITGHTIVEQYDVTLPFTIQTPSGSRNIDAPARRHLPTPVLQSDSQIAGLSESVPPAFSTNHITMRFRDISDYHRKKLRRFTLQVQIGNDQHHVNLTKCGQNDNQDFVVDLSSFIDPDVCGTYQVNVMHGLRPRLTAPIEFSVLPSIRIHTPDDRLFSPLASPSITLKSIPGQLNLPENARHRKGKSNQYVVEWTDLKQARCRLEVTDGVHTVPLAWDIQRLHAWVEHTESPHRLLPDDIGQAVFVFRGPASYNLWLHIGKQTKEITLNARGEYQFELAYSKFYDLLITQQQTSIPIELDLPHGRWKLTTFVKQAEVKQFGVEYLIEDDKEWLAVDVDLFQSVDSDVYVQLVSQSNGTVVLERVLPDVNSLNLLHCYLSPGSYEVKLIADGQPLQLPRPCELIVELPRLIDISATYSPQESMLDVQYTLDNARPGTYTLQIEDKNGDVHAEKEINPLDEQLSIETYLPAGFYYVSLQWDNTPFGKPRLFAVGRAATQQPRQLNAKVSSAGSVEPQLETNRLVTWLTRLLQAPPETLSTETRYRLATLPAGILKGSAQPALSSLWQPLSHLVAIQTPRLWIQQHGYIPSRFILNYALQIITNENRSYLLYPECAIERGTGGIGKITLDTPQEGRLYGYARWDSRGEQKARLRVWIPPYNPSHPFIELDELDMFPAYYDRISGDFHGARQQYISPGRTSSGALLVDAANTYTLIVRIRQTERELRHTLSIQHSIDRKFTRDILCENIEQIKGLSRSATQITKAAGYRNVTLRWLLPCLEDKQRLADIRYLVQDDSLLHIYMTSLANWLHRRATVSSVPLFVGASRFLNAMEQQVKTESAPKLMRLDRNIFLLAVALRAKSLPSVASRRLFRDLNELSDITLSEFTATVDTLCPELLDWALTWAELLSVHSKI